VAQGIDLGLRLGLERLGLRDPRLGAARAVDIAGKRRSRSYGLPETTRSGAKGPGKGGKAHQGLVVAGAAAEDVVDDGRAAGAVGSSRASGYRRASGSWTT
jgi:hypothetical protein